jgi:hypothetical protein
MHTENCARRMSDATVASMRGFGVGRPSFGGRRTWGGSGRAAVQRLSGHAQFQSCTQRLPSARSWSFGTLACSPQAAAQPGGQADVPSARRLPQRWGADFRVRGFRRSANRASRIVELTASAIEATNRIGPAGRWFCDKSGGFTVKRNILAQPGCASVGTTNGSAARLERSSVRVTSALRASVLRRAVSLSGTTLARGAPIAAGPWHSHHRHLTSTTDTLVVRAARASFATPRAVPKTLRPNPSVNATANGMALGPRSTANYHVLRGPSTMPSSARYLKR